MPQALIILALVVLALGTFMAIRGVNVRQRRERDRYAYEAQVSWENARQVKDLMSLYLDVLLVHGPDSREAKAFLFGVDNKQFWKENDALAVFQEMTSICNSAVRRHKVWKNR